MEFNRLLSQAINFYGEPDGKVVEQSVKSVSKKIDVTKYKTINKIADFDKLLKKLEDQSLISVDTETSSLNPLEADLVGISVCYSPNEAYYIPVKHKKKIV